MSRTRILLLLALGVLGSTPGNSQQQAPQSGSVDAKLIPGAGNGSSGKVFSPDLFNGTANVSIPIYSYGSEGVSLGYNTAGVKIDEQSGAVGVHWNLAAGGSIQRILKDMPDEMNWDQNPVMSLPGVGGGAGAMEYVWGIKGRLWHYFGGTNAASDDGSRYQDLESDDFIVSVGGLSFTFNIGMDGYIHTHPHQNIKIEMLINGSVINGNPVSPLPVNLTAPGITYTNNVSTLNFRIRDVQGNWYYFVKGDESRKYFGDPDAPDLAFGYTSRWVIQKIVKNDGLEVNYEYTYNDNSQDETGTYMSYTGEEKDGAVPIVSGALVKVKHQLLSSARLSAIKYPNNVKASFVYTADYYRRCDCLPVDPNYPSNKGDQILREIRISADEAMMRYVFDQAYSVSPKSGSSVPEETPLGTCIDVDGAESYRYHRLILKGIHMENESGTKTEPYYKFGYENDPRLPARFSSAQDYFGYYNGGPLGSMMNIPSHTPKYGTSSTPYGVGKDGNSNYAIAGLLDTVINAYGAITFFSYEGHSLVNVVSDANPGITLPTSDPYFLGLNANDGVRVGFIRTIDPKYPNRYQQQSFTYSGGQRFMPGGYFDYKLNSAGNNTLFNGNYISPHQFINGSNHGYSNITVTNSSDAGQLSKRLMTFKNISRGLNNTSYYKLGSTQYFEAPYTDKQYIKDWEIGLPLETTEYDKDDRILSHTINSYSNVEYLNNTSGNIENTKKLSAANGDLLDVIAQDVYRPYSGLSLLTQTEVRKYISNTSYTSDIVTYAYDERNNLKSTFTQDSRGQQFRLDNIYNYKISGPGLTYGNQTGTTLYNMTADGLELRVSMERWKLSTVNSPFNDQVFDASITGYQYQSGKIWTKKLYTLRSLDPVGYTAYTAATVNPPANNVFGKVLMAYNTGNTPSGFQLASEVLEYDSKGNPVETQLMGQDAYQSMIWDAVTGNKVAEVQNAHVEDIAFTSFESTIYGASYTGSENIVNGGFTYKHGGLFLSDPITGKATFRLTFTGPYKTVTTPILTAGKDYIMTFWAKGGKPRFKGAGLLDVDYIEIHTVGDWSCYEARFTPTTTDAMVIENHIGGFMYVDEIRLYPKGAMMTSQVYTPLYGISSSTDARGRITYYQYDAFGRNIVVKDQEGSVLSKKEYHVAQ